MAYETTAVSIDKSQNGIRKVLMAHGATGIAFISQVEPERVEGFEMMLPVDGQTYRVRFVAHPKIDPKMRVEKADQELRRVWRVLYYHVKAIFEAASTGVLEFREMVLPYIVVFDGRTVSQHILPKLEDSLAGRTDRLLPAKKP